MLAFCWLDPKFRFHACHFVYSPVFRRQRSNLIIPVAPTHLLLLLHPTIVYYSCQIPMSCTNTDGFWTLAEFFIFYQRDTDELIYTCAHVTFGLPPLHWRFGCFNQAVNPTLPLITLTQGRTRIAYYYTISYRSVP